MNKQNNGKGKRGIEWTDYTWNPIGGCLHGCAWKMPDGSLANCYAEDVANKLAQSAYPNGFEAHYWRPEALAEPLSVKTPARIFCGSMADVFGHWVPDEQIKAVLDACRVAHWHTFQFLTKNAPRLKRFDFPPNAWVGISAPPSQMMGKSLSQGQQDRWFNTALNALGECNATVKWVSFEPLSYDMAYTTAFYTEVIDWAVIGAASNGNKYYQPQPEWVLELLTVLCGEGIPVFFKGNLRGNPAAARWREEFPNKESAT